MKSEWGPCYYDVAHVLTAYAVYDLPFGRGRRFGKDIHPVANAVLGGWTISPILSIHGGFPLTISAGDASGTHSRGARSNCIAPPHDFWTRQYSVAGCQWLAPVYHLPP